MKQPFLLLLMFSCFITHSQIMNEEKQLRQSANFISLINDVKSNNTKGCLCNNNEYVVFSFNTKNNKTASLCISKTISATSGYLLYRFGTKTKIE
jgi:hypothetical protein